MKNELHDRYDQSEYFRFQHSDLFYKDIDHLIGILSGIKADAVINNNEVAALQHWMRNSSVPTESDIFKTLEKHINSHIASGKFLKEDLDEVVSYCQAYTKENKHFKSSTSKIRELTGLLHGISADGVINEYEVRTLDQWLESNTDLRNLFPYDEVYSLVTQIVSDGCITAEEKEELLHLAKALADISLENTNDLFVRLAKNLYHVDPEIILAERNFVITGLSSKYPRRHIAEQIELRGGFVQNGISKQTHYLIICANKNECWAMASFGRKIEKAMQLRRDGHGIAIVHENDLYDTIMA